MTKRKSDASVPEEEQQLLVPEADEEAPGELAAAEEPKATKGKKKAEEPKHKRSDLVRVRFIGEMGLLAGKAVYNGEVHAVRYWQYLQACETGGEAYQLVAADGSEA